MLLLQSGMAQSIPCNLAIFGSIELSLLVARNHLTSPHADYTLLTVADNRGFMTQNGQPDNPRSARYILKDFVKGKLLYCHAPPIHDQTQYHTFPVRTKQSRLATLPPLGVRLLKVNGSPLHVTHACQFHHIKQSVYLKA